MIEIIKSIIRSYSLQHKINSSKQEEIIETLYLYRHLAKQLANIQWQLFNKTHKFNKNDKTKPETLLSARYIQTCRYQVVGTVR